MDVTFRYGHLLLTIAEMAASYGVHCAAGSGISGGEKFAQVFAANSRARSGQRPCRQWTASRLAASLG
jgi:hypothetical protein